MNFAIALNHKKYTSFSGRIFFTKIIIFTNANFINVYRSSGANVSNVMDALEKNIDEG